MKTLLFIAGVIVLIFLILVGVKSVDAPVESVEEEKTTETNTSTNGASATTPQNAGETFVDTTVLEISDINPGGRSVSVARVQMSVSGFVIIRENAGGAPGAIIGVSRNIGPGLVINVPIELDRETVNNDILYAQLYRDNGNGIFSIQDDAPLKDANGKAISKTFFADVATE